MAIFLDILEPLCKSRTNTEFISKKMLDCILQDNGQKNSKVRFYSTLKFLCSSSPEEKLNDRRMLDISAKKIIDDLHCLKTNQKVSFIDRERAKRAKFFFTFFGTFYECFEI